MAAPTKSSFSKPDQTAHPTKNMTVDIVTLGDRKFHRVTIQPGWRWTKDLGPVVGAETCQTEHLLYMLSGRMTVHSDSGEEVDYTTGDLASIPPGHDGWTVGDEPAVWIEIPH
jgi:quercetin dioxygenase-like cupin family protein